MRQPTCSPHFSGLGWEWGCLTQGNRALKSCSKFNPGGVKSRSIWASTETWTLLSGSQRKGTDVPLGDMWIGYFRFMVASRSAFGQADWQILVYFQPWLASLTIITQAELALMTPGTQKGLLCPSGGWRSGQEASFSVAKDHTLLSEPGPFRYSPSRTLIKACAHEEITL